MRRAGVTMRAPSNVLVPELLAVDTASFGRFTVQWVGAPASGGTWAGPTAKELICAFLSRQWMFASHSKPGASHWRVVGWERVSNQSLAAYAQLDGTVVLVLLDAGTIRLPLARYPSKAVFWARHPFPTHRIPLVASPSLQQVHLLHDAIPVCHT